MAANQAKDSKFSWLMKDSFDFSFVDEDIKLEKSKEKANKQKKKSKADKESTKDVDSSVEQE